jgi:hypothetical protein
MEEAPIEDKETIFELAAECERLYAEQISRLNDDDEPNGATILSELNQRFATWAAFLGVFAEPNVCLDRRLRHHVDIQDQVLRLLDIMQRNLTYCVSSCLPSPVAWYQELTAEIVFEADHSPERMEIESSDMPKQSPQRRRVSMDGLEAISGAIERLNHLGIAIRQSSVTSQSAKARKFAETFDFTSFEEVAYLALKALYADAGEELLEQLTRSMTETYALHCRRKYRQEQLQNPRSRTRTLIPEELTADADADADVDADAKMQDLQLSKDSTPASPRLVRPLPHSEPTSVDSQEVKSKFRKAMNPSIKGKTMSILAKQVDYPRPPKGSLTCIWCFGPLPIDAIEGVKWKYETPNPLFSLEIQTHSSDSSQILVNM